MGVRGSAMLVVVLVVVGMPMTMLMAVRSVVNDFLMLLPRHRNGLMMIDTRYIDKTGGQ
jgi:hypothetical protein